MDDWGDSLLVGRGQCARNEVSTRFLVKFPHKIDCIGVAKIDEHVSWCRHMLHDIENAMHREYIVW
jgi:hypothetical protein